MRCCYRQKYGVLTDAIQVQQLEAGRDSEETVSIVRVPDSITHAHLAIRTPRACILGLDGAVDAVQPAWGGSGNCAVLWSTPPRLHTMACTF